MKTYITLSLFVILIASSLTGSAIFDYDDHPAWYWYTYPESPPDDNCYGSTIFTNVTPYNGEEEIEITAKGVQVCVNITPPAGCNITVQYQWFNWTDYYDDYFEWCDEQDWGHPDNWEDWWNDIDWDNKTDPENSSYWHNFSSTYSNINTTTTICSYNTNVSCYIDGDWEHMFNDWRINYTIDCSGNITTGDCYYYYEAEECPNIKYISPPSPNGTICPCCDSMCISVNETEGHPMNLTFYRNDTQFEDFYIVNTFNNVHNGTYCFCIDGHHNNSIYYPMKFNETYHWYVNITDTVNDEYVETRIFQFRTYPLPKFCPCGPDEITEMMEDTDTDTIRDDAWLIGATGLLSIFGILAYMKRRKK